MKRDKIKTMEEFFTPVFEYLKAVSFVFVAAIAGLAAHVLKKIRSRQKIKRAETISIVVIAGVIGYASYYLVDLLNLESMNDNIKGSISAMMGLFSEVVYKTAPNFIGNLLKGKLNIKEDCKMDKDE